MLLRKVTSWWMVDTVWGLLSPAKIEHTFSCSELAFRHLLHGFALFGPISTQRFQYGNVNGSIS